jgi:hypothetical protein
MASTDIELVPYLQYRGDCEEAQPGHECAGSPLWHPVDGQLFEINNFLVNDIQ